jgi:tRNA(adenine34) deaminase
MADDKGRIAQETGTAAVASMEVTAAMITDDALHTNAHTGAPIPVRRQRSPYEGAMREALRQAQSAAVAGDMPIGAVVLNADGAVIATGRNMREAHCDPLSHAEVEAMRAAARALGTWNLADCMLVVTLEPCPMCAGAAVSAHMGRIVFGAWDPKMGACGSVWDIPRDPHVGAMPQVYGGVLESDCSRQLTAYFHTLRTVEQGKRQ